MKRFTVAFDLDDVLANFIASFIAISRAKWGRPEANTVPVDWEWSNCGWSKEEIDELWAEVSQTANFWTMLPPVKGVSSILLRDMEQNHNVVFPTARAYSVGMPVGLQSAVWLQDTFGLVAPAVFVSSAKGELAKALKYDYFIDDRPKNCIEVKQAMPTCKVFLQDSGHNKAFDEKFHGITRISHVNDFMLLILEESNDGVDCYGCQS